MKLGCILFDDPQEHRSAWVCLDGGSPYRIRGIEDISNDVVWLTNLVYEEMHAAGFSNHAFLRRSSFLRLRHDAILKEVGLHESSPDIQVRFLASIFGRTSRLMQRHLAYPKVPLGELRHTVREVLLPPDPKMTPDAIHAFRDATQEYITAERISARQKKGAGLVGLWFPRVDHAMKVLGVRVPSSAKFDELPRRSLPFGKDYESMQAWIIEQGGPMLMRILIKNVIDEDVYPLINYGAGVMPKRDRGRGRMIKTWTPARQWATSTEVLYMLPFVDIEILEARLFKETRRLIDLPLVQRFFESLTPAHRVSYSTGLFAENIWMGAVSSLELVPKANESTNILAPFLRAQDRSLCFAAARTLHGFGIEVTGYGAGRIHISGGHMDDPGLIVESCSEAGLIPEPIPEYADELQFSGRDRDVMTLQTVAMHGSWDVMDQIDSFAIPKIDVSPDDQAA